MNPVGTAALCIVCGYGVLVLAAALINRVERRGRTPDPQDLTPQDRIALYELIRDISLAMRSVLDANDWKTAIMDPDLMQQAITLNYNTPTGEQIRKLAVGVGSHAEWQLLRFIETARREQAEVILEGVRRLAEWWEKNYGNELLEKISPLGVPGWVVNFFREFLLPSPAFGEGREVLRSRKNCESPETEDGGEGEESDDFLAGMTDEERRFYELFERVQILDTPERGSKIYSWTDREIEYHVEIFRTPKGRTAQKGAQDEEHIDAV